MRKKYQLINNVRKEDKGREREDKDDTRLRE